MKRIRKTATVDEIVAMRPCRSREHIAKLFGSKKCLHLRHLIAMPVEKLSYAERVWVLLHKQFIPEKELHLLACRIAERALRRERKAGLEPDPCSWEAVRIKRLWVRGKATSEKLADAQDAARDAVQDTAGAAAAWYAAGVAARAAAWHAAWCAARGATGDVAGAAALVVAWATEAKWQYNAILRVLKRLYN
jgi:hypothetical protein